jgi:hypothetical protein
MDARNLFPKRLDARLKSRLALFGAAVLVAMFAFILQANAKCSVKSADPLIVERYTGCKKSALLSYLGNDLITPYSFSCAKKVETACKESGCANPATVEETTRCLNLYVGVLETCPKQLEDAALMARCTDAKVWAVDTVAARILPSAGAHSLVASAVADTTLRVAPNVGQNPTNADVPVSTLSTVSSVLPGAKNPTHTDLSVSSVSAVTNALPAAKNPTSAFVGSIPTNATVAVSIPPAVSNSGPTAAAIVAVPVAVAPVPTAARAPATTRDFSDVAVIQLSPPAKRSSTIKTTPSSPSETTTNYGPNPATTNESSPSVTAEPLPPGDLRLVRKSTRSSQSSRRLR